MRTTEATSHDRLTRMAETWWRTHQPDQWAAIPDQATFLERVSTQVRHETYELQAQLQAAQSPAADYLDHVAQIRQTQRQAEELTLHRWFPPEGGPGHLPYPRA